MDGFGLSHTRVMGESSISASDWGDREETWEKREPAGELERLCDGENVSCVFPSCVGRDWNWNWNWEETMRER